VTATVAAVRAGAADIRVMCYSDGNECESTEALAARFMKDNPDIKITVEKVPYQTILQGLPVQLAAGNGPDIARVTIAGPIMQYFLDLRPYLRDPGYWDDNFGPHLMWLRRGEADRGIYGMPTQLTVTGPIVNKTLFDQANLPLPQPAATWDEWASTVVKVAQATKVPFGMAWDRSGHRFAGPAISNGARYFAPDGKPDVVDDGFKAIAGRFVTWNQDATVDKGVWAAAGGGSYRDAFEEFANAQIVLYLSGSWQLSRLQKQIADAFDWVVVPNPCGSAGCSGMPGGASFVAFKETKSPKEVARFLDWLASEPVYAEYMAMTANIPALARLQSGGVKYNLSGAASAAMAAFVANATKLSPVAYKLQGNPLSGSIFTATVERLTQAINRQLTLDQAYERIASDIAQAMAAGAQK
jgi:alpha-1,4-digalacturonate transport system substrate-binding protein